MTDLAKTYQKKTEKEHILSNPDTYIGSVDNSDTDIWVYDTDSPTPKIAHRQILYNPGLFKLFDEAIVNCRDHVIRMVQKKGTPVTYIHVTVDDVTGRITMTNDGDGVDVEKHPEHNTWIPELIFAHLRTSTNYDKTEKKIVGGKNGLGACLILIWSTEAQIETVDSTRKLKYTQSFHNNLDIMDPPSITKCSKKSYTTISFIPDYARLGLPNGLSPQMKELFHKRAYDISAITDKSVRVKYNDSTLAVKTFKQYIDLYIGKSGETKRIYEESKNERWEYVVSISPYNEFTQVSFVNGISTPKGGKHVDYILGQIIRKCIDYIETKKKTKVNYSAIKEQLMLFLRCDIENPSFDSQTKDTLTTPSNHFGSYCTVTPAFIEGICNGLKVMSSACEVTELRENRQTKNKSDGSKTKNIRGIPKYISANFAGTVKSKECTLILCEGDSAKAGILSGLSMEDKDIFGVYPLKGKLMNVRGEAFSKIYANKEIIEITKIMGLITKHEYNTTEDVNTNLRYSKIMFMTDQDLDGSHIKGLCINLFACEWPSLMKIPGFVSYMNTPILKATKGKQELEFYNDVDYNKWKETTPNSSSWHVKYYKGLGTSTSVEFKKYFKNRRVIDFSYNDTTSDPIIDMVFNKKRACDRKTWLQEYDPNNQACTTSTSVSYDDFVNHELIHFSKYDCDRSIPCIMDGLKTSLRKILYSAFKKNLTHEIKVAQFSGYVSEHSGYHHGEMSLNQAIVGMAQNFVGSNNVNLLFPSGQFGTRLRGGKDSASERYIYTRLNDITKIVYNELDFPTLKYLDDDGFSVEPEYYVPIIPMILVNGSKGIGTGFSTDIMCYNPIDICNYLKHKLNGSIDANMVNFEPYYEGFTGTTIRLDDGRVIFKGKYSKIGMDKICITELPVGTWTQDYVEFLEELESSTDKKGAKIVPPIKNIKKNITDTTVCIEVTFTNGKLAQLEMVGIDPMLGISGVEKALNLYSTGSTTNMHMFDVHGKLKKYSTIQSIIDEYFDVRMHYYGLRKQAIIDKCAAQTKILDNKSKYIGELLDGTIDLRRKKRTEIIEMLVSKKYDRIGDDSNDEDDSASAGRDYNYLLNMRMDSVSAEKADKLQNESIIKRKELEKITKTSTKDMWLTDLDQFLEMYLNTIKGKTIDTTKKPNDNPFVKNKKVKIC